MNKIKNTIGEFTIIYTWEYYRFSHGELIVYLDGQFFDFGENSLYYVLDDPKYIDLVEEEEQIIKNKKVWEIKKWPTNFPSDKKEKLLEVINESIPAYLELADFDSNGNYLK